MDLLSRSPSGLLSKQRFGEKFTAIANGTHNETNVAQAALHVNKQRRPIPRRQEGILIESREDLDFSINYRNEMAICTKIWNTTYDGTPGVRQHGFGFKSYKEKKLEMVPTMMMMRMKIMRMIMMRQKISKLLKHKADDRELDDSTSLNGSVI